MMQMLHPNVTLVSFSHPKVSRLVTTLISFRHRAAGEVRERLVENSFTHCVTKRHSKTLVSAYKSSFSLPGSGLFSFGSACLISLSSSSPPDPVSQQHLSQQITITFQKQIAITIMKIPLVSVLVLLVICCSLSSMLVEASVRYEKGLVMGYLLGNYRNLNGRLGMVPIPLILAAISK
jgi:hypothetical protein